MKRKLAIILTLTAALSLGLPAKASAAPTPQDTACLQAALTLLRAQDQFTNVVQSGSSFQALLQNLREQSGQFSGGELVLPGGGVLLANWCESTTGRRGVGAAAPGINLSISASAGATFRVSVNGGTSSSSTSYWSGSVPSMSYVSITGTFGQFSPGGPIGAGCAPITNLGLLNSTGCTISGEFGKASISLTP
jgi:hypothetical protein